MWLVDFELIFDIYFQKRNTTSHWFFFLKKTFTSNFVNDTLIVWLSRPITCKFLHINDMTAVFFPFTLWWQPSGWNISMWFDIKMNNNRPVLKICVRATSLLMDNEKTKRPWKQFDKPSCPAPSLPAAYRLSPRRAYLPLLCRQREWSIFGVGCGEGGWRKGGVISSRVAGGAEARAAALKPR